MTLPVHGRGKIQEVLPQPWRGLRVNGRIVKDATEFLASTEDFTSPAPAPSGICRCKVEQFQRSSECRLEARGVPCLMSADRTIHLTTDVRQLFQDRQPTPTLRESSV